MLCVTYYRLQAHWRDVLQGRKNSMNITELFLHFAGATFTATFIYLKSQFDPNSHFAPSNAGCKFCEEFPEKKPRSENLQECIQQLEQVAQTTMRMRG